MSGQLDPKGQSNPNGVDEDFTELSDEELGKKLAEDSAEQDNQEVEVKEEEPEKGQPLPKTEDPKEPESKESVDQSEEELKKAHEALKKEHENLQMLYGRLTNEVGELRRLVPDKPTQNDFDDDSVKATEQLQERNNKLNQIQAKEREAQILAMRQSNLAFHTEHTPDLKANLEGIRQVLIKEDGIDSDSVNRFIGNILDMNPFAINQLNKRYKQQIEINKLKKQIEELKTSSGKAVKKMVAINNQAPSVTSGTGESQNSDDGVITDPVLIASMSQKDLESQLVSSLKKEKLNNG